MMLVLPPVQRHMRRCLWAAVLACLALADDSDRAAASEAAGAEGGNAATKDLLQELTINMGSDVIDECTFIVRDTSAKGRKKLRMRLGNCAPLERRSMDEERRGKKMEAAKRALAQFVEKQMIFWKSAPEAAQRKEQPEGDEATIVADVWTLDGQHLSTALAKAGHVAKTDEYQSELARDILTAESDSKKQESYKELEEAIKESEKAKRKEAREAAKAKKEEPKQPFDLAWWISIGVVTLLLVGVATNFGRTARRKKVNLNKKDGMFEQFFAKFKVQ